MENDGIIASAPHSTAGHIAAQPALTGSRAAAHLPTPTAPYF